MKNRLTLQSPVGELVLTEEDAQITRLCLPGENPPSDFQEQHTPLLDRAAQELEEYFAGKRKQFDLPLNPAGTEFQHRIWQELEKIPYGEVITYGELARRTGNPKASRAVGQANHRNPIAILIPCHRVIAGGGKLGGYGGGTEIKRKLLVLEEIWLF